MRTSAAGRAFIAGEEWAPRSARCGWDEEKQLYFPYKDYRGFWTMGCGHLVKEGDDFSAGLSEAGVDELFSKDLEPVENAIHRNVTIPLQQHQLDTLVDFGFNEGVGALDPKNCTFIRNLNHGDWAAPLNPVSGLAEWNKSRVHPGGPLAEDANLSRRRAAECHLWSTPWPEEPEQVQVVLLDLQLILRGELDPAHA